MKFSAILLLSLLLAFVAFSSAQETFGDGAEVDDYEDDDYEDDDDEAVDVSGRGYGYGAFPEGNRFHGSYVRRHPVEYGNIPRIHFSRYSRWWRRGNKLPGQYVRGRPGYRSYRGRY